MANIGIIGGGIAGLHLGHFLRQHGVACTIYSVQSPEEIANGRIQNTVAHHNTTLERERQLGIHFWDAAEHGYVCHWHYFGGEHPLLVAVLQMAAAGRIAEQAGQAWLDGQPVFTPVRLEFAPT